jgi:protein SCO1
MSRSNTRRYLIPALLGFAAVFAACQHEPKPQEQYFKLRGVVVSVDRPNMQIVVKHEAIPGFMQAMTMGYPVEDETALKKLAPGDQITARVVVGAQGMWLDNIVIQKHSETPPASPPKHSSPGK